MPDPTPVTPEALAAQLAKFVADARAKAQGGLTVAEFGTLVVELLHVAVTGLDAIPSDGPSKKAWALSAVALLFAFLVITLRANQISSISEIS